MRNISKMFLLSAGIILSLAGCQKGTTPSNLTGKAIRFSAAAGSVNTRTAFSGEGTGSGTDEFGRNLLTWERIDWKVGDAVLIASDNATIYQDSDTHFATYTVASVKADGDISEAELDEKAGSEELFFNENEKYAFWAIYPATAGTGADLLNKTAKYTIKGNQGPDSFSGTEISATTDANKKLKTLVPDMTQAVMLAAAEDQTAEKVDLDFYPGFTAFEFTLNSAGGDLLLNKLVLTPAPVGEGEDAVVTTSLAGDVVASIKAGGTSTFTTTYPATKALTYTFPDNPVISTTDYLTFTVFALPETIKGLVLEFHMGENGEIVQKAALKKNGADITFDPCKKYNLRGIAVKGGWTFELDGQVLDWEYLEKETDFGEQVQSSAFEDHFVDPMRLIVGADETKTGEDVSNYVAFDPLDQSYTLATYAEYLAMSASEKQTYQTDHPTYQYRFYQNRTLLPTAEYFDFSFTPQAPRAGYWMFEPQGDIEMFDLYMMDADQTNYSKVEMSHIQGQIMNQPVKFQLKPSSLVPSTRTQSYAIYFKVYFSSNVNFEPALSADSEVQDVHSDGSFSYWHFVIPANN